MTQRYTRYFFLLNLFGFFFVSATALEMEQDDHADCRSACVFSCSESASSPPSLVYDLQPILGAAIAHEADTPETVSTPTIHEAPTAFQSVETLAVAPKQSPPTFA